MSFDRPTPPPLTYPDLRAETEQGPRLLAFRILEFLPPEESDYTDRTTGTRAKIYPVLCDVMIIDGPNAGTVYFDAEGEPADFLGAKARHARDVYRIALARPEFERALLARVASRALGRDPTPDELATLDARAPRVGLFRAVVELALGASS